MSIDHDHPNLVNEIVKKMTDLPEVLCKKIVRAMKDDKFQPQFYQNLSGLS